MSLPDQMIKDIQEESSNLLEKRLIEKQKTTASKETGIRGTGNESSFGRVQMDQQPNGPRYLPSLAWRAHR
jgi:hypothetical protein